MHVVERGQRVFALLKLDKAKAAVRAALLVRRNLHVTQVAKLRVRERWHGARCCHATGMKAAASSGGVTLSDSPPTCSVFFAKLIGDEQGGEAKHLTTALAQNDSIAETLLASLTRDLAFALSHVTHLFHPQVITLGGGLALIGEPLREGITEKLPEFLMEIYGNGPQIKLAELGEDAVPVGALLL